MEEKLLDEHQVLVETLLPTEWTWGCELEGYQRGAINNSYAYDDEDEDEDYDDDDDYSYLYDETYDTLINCLEKNCDSNLYDDSHSEVHSDGSLNNIGNNLAFEWATPIFKATPKAFEGFVHTLYDLFKDGEIYTNDDCGFHHHLMYNGMNERDCIWIYCNLAMDDDFIDETIDFDDFSLYSQQWSSINPFTIIRKSIKNDDWSTVLGLLSTDKYRLFRIHPQGTLEWRGPRDFLNEAALEVIKDFYYKHLQKVIMKFIEYNRSTTLFGTNISKNEFFEKLTEAKKEYSNQGIFGDNEFILNNYGNYHNKNKNPNIERKMNVYKVLEKLKNKPILLSYLVRDKSPFLDILFKNIMNSGAANLYNIKEVLEEIQNTNAWLIDKKEYTKRIVDACLNAGYTISQMVGNYMFDYLDPSILSKDILKQDLLKTYNDKNFKLYAEKATLGEMEHLLYEMNNNILFISYAWRDYPHYLEKKYGGDAVLKYCYFLVKLIYQRGYLHANLNPICKILRDYVKKYGDNDFLTKWNNMALSLTVNKNPKFAGLIITLTPEEYVRLASEFPDIKYYISDDITIPEEAKEIADKM